MYLEHYTLSPCPPKSEGELFFAPVCIVAPNHPQWPEEPLTIKALISHHLLQLLLVPLAHPEHDTAMNTHTRCSHYAQVAEARCCAHMKKGACSATAVVNWTDFGARF